MCIYWCHTSWHMKQVSYNSCRAFHSEADSNSFVGQIVTDSWSWVHHFWSESKWVVKRGSCLFQMSPKYWVAPSALMIMLTLGDMNSIIMADFLQTEPQKTMKHNGSIWCRVWSQPLGKNCVKCCPRACRMAVTMKELSLNVFPP